MDMWLVSITIREIYGRVCVSGPVFNLQNHFIDFDEGIGGLCEIYFMQVLLESEINISKVLCSASQYFTHKLLHAYKIFN
jgi:hypothetical protein